MEAETSTRNIVTVYCIGRGYVSIIPRVWATVSTHSCTLRGHPEYEKWWLWSKASEVEAQWAIAVPVATRGAPPRDAFDPRDLLYRSLKA